MYERNPIRVKLTTNKKTNMSDAKKEPSREEVIDTAMEIILSGDHDGVCLECGWRHSDIEPDAEKVQCQACGYNKVYGAEQLVIMFA